MNGLSNSVGHRARDDALGNGRGKPACDANLHELIGRSAAVAARPIQEPTDVVSQGGQGAFAAVGEGSELDGATADDGGQVGGRTGSGGLRWRWGGGTGCRRGGGADDLAGEPGGHVAGVGAVAAAYLVGAGGGDGAGGDAVGPSGFEVDLPGQAVPAGWVGEGLAQVGGGGLVPQVRAAGGTWEIIGLLAARAPRLDRALAAIKKEGGEAVLLDGTLIPTRRRTGTANRKNYNGKHKKHGLLFLALTDQAGNVIWISSACRGAASEIRAARHDHITGHLRTAGLGALADLGFTGLDPGSEDPVIITGCKATATRKLTPAQRHANQALSAARAPVEHGFSDLKNWRILTRLRLSPAKATTVLRALLVLTRQHTIR
jgi:hypothetical protein